MLVTFVDVVFVKFVEIVFVTFVDTLSAAFTILSKALTKVSVILFKYLLFLQIHVLGIKLYFSHQK